jgi:hypothetical protein
MRRSAKADQKGNAKTLNFNLKGTKGKGERRRKAEPKMKIRRLGVSPAEILRKD